MSFGYSFKLPKEQRVARARAKRAQNVPAKKQYDRDRRLNRTTAALGLKLPDAEAMLAAQGGACAICARAVLFGASEYAARACLDHCHETGRVRGVLCPHCNLAIGNLRDNPVNCDRAAAYLRKSL